MNGRVSYFSTNQNYTLLAPTINSYAASNQTPAFNETFFITSAVTNETAVYLGYRTSHELRFTRIPMFDDGNHGDGAPGDHTYGASVTANGPIFEYYIYADNANAGLFSPQRAEHEFHSLDLNIPAPSVGQVQINEAMSDNELTHDDPYGESNDWVELHNTTPNAIDLSGMFLSDDLMIPQKWMIPSNTVMLPNAYLIIWTDNDTLQTTGLHTNFKLGSSGDFLSLANGTTVYDQVSIPGLLADQSYSRCPESGVVFDTAVPTFNAMNNCSAGLEPIEWTTLIYPNPTTDVLNLDFPKSAKYDILDINWRLVYAGEEVHGTTQLNTANWNNGLYLVIVHYAGGETQAIKFIKQ
jgi:hypothetical protein